ncbi:MAG: ATP-binding protein [Sedimentisphaerales bacterium]|nr:ATP-binding protein [Sedimentisphaerales bacterium]
MTCPYYQDITIPSRYPHAKAVEDRIVLEAQQTGYDEESIFALRLSLEESLTNAIRHGNASDASKHVSVKYRITQDRIDVVISDEGSGFDPCSIPDPTQPEFLSRPSGRGILLMRAYMNEVTFNSKGNRVHLVKFRNHQAGSQAS